MEVSIQQRQVQQHQYLVPGDVCNVILFGNSITSIGSTTVTARAADSLSNSNYTLLEDETRTLMISAGLFIKLSGNWTPVKQVFKLVSGDWVLQNPTSAFSTTAKYVKLN